MGEDGCSMNESMIWRGFEGLPAADQDHRLDIGSLTPAQLYELNQVASFVSCATASSILRRAEPPGRYHPN